MARQPLVQISRWPPPPASRARADPDIADDDVDDLPRDDGRDRDDQDADGGSQRAAARGRTRQRRWALKARRSGAAAATLATAATVQTTAGRRRGLVGYLLGVGGSKPSNPAEAAWHGQSAAVMGSRSTAPPSSATTTDADGETGRGQGDGEHRHAPAAQHQESIDALASGNPTAEAPSRGLPQGRCQSRCDAGTCRYRYCASHPRTDSVKNGRKKQASTTTSSAGGTDHDTVRLS